MAGEIAPWGEAIIFDIRILLQRQLTDNILRQAVEYFIYTR